MSVLDVDGLTVQYGGGRTAVTAVSGVGLTVERGRVLGLVGESGSGKSTVAKAIMGLVPISAGSISIAGRPLSGKGRGWQRERARRVQLVFQDPFSSLNPRMRIRAIVAEPLELRDDVSRADADDEVARLLDLVGLEPDFATRLPGQLSGGQRQRVAIARALAARPDLLIADEITSALDVSVQAHILNLLRDIQRARGLAILLVSHNLATVRYLSDEVAVMRRGRIVEHGPTQQVIDAPSDDYTAQLLAAVPNFRVDPTARRSTHPHQSSQGMETNV